MALIHLSCVHSLHPEVRKRGGETGRQGRVLAPCSCYSILQASPTLCLCRTGLTRKLDGSEGFSRPSQGSRSGLCKLSFSVASFIINVHCKFCLIDASMLLSNMFLFSRSRKTAVLKKMFALRMQWVTEDGDWIDNIEACMHIFPAVNANPFPSFEEESIYSIMQLSCSIA